MIYLISFCGHTNDQRHLQLTSFEEAEVLDADTLGVKVAHGMSADFLTRIPTMWEEMRMGSAERHYSPSSVLTYRVSEEVYLKAKELEGNKDKYDADGNRTQGYNLDHDAVWDLVQVYVNAAKSGVSIETTDY
jgi:hypothetical protein